MDPSTLSHHKSAFLLSQIRLLSTPLHPSPTQLSPSNPSETLPPKLLTDLLTRINAKLTQHNKSVFPATTQRIVVEQIESLYFDSALTDLDLDLDLADLRPDGEAVEQVDQQDHDLLAISRSIDFSSSTLTTLGLPDELHQCMLLPSHSLHSPSNPSLSDADHNAETYHNLRLHLQHLSQRRDAATQKLQQYRRLEQLLKPFESVGESVQPNLVGREGEMAREMEKMRGLLARVRARMGEGGGVGVVDSGEGRGEGAGLDDRGFDEKLRGVMQMGSS